MQAGDGVKVVAWRRRDNPAGVYPALPRRKRSWEQGCGVGSGAGCVAELADHDITRVGSSKAHAVVTGIGLARLPVILLWPASSAESSRRNRLVSFATT